MASIWLVNVGELLPTRSGTDRLQRCGMLALELTNRGHQVRWWTATFEHFAKRHVAMSRTKISPWDNLELDLVHTPGYQKNVSVARLRDHHKLAQEFRKAAYSAPDPDIVISSLPTIELNHEAVEFSHRRGIPCVVDVRDLWPDVFTTILPQVLRPLGRLALLPIERSVGRSLSRATRLTAVSETYLNWGCERAGRTRRNSDAVFPIGYQRRHASESDVADALESLRARGVDPSKRIIWYVGGFGCSYDLGTVIEAARQLAADGETSVQFVISGSGERERQLREQARGLTNVVFTGWVNAAGIDAMTRTASLSLAAYSRQALQSLPNKIFEYMSGGLPVLSSLQGECAALLERNGCGETYNSTTELADCLRGFCRNAQEWAEMGKRSAALFYKEYDSTVVYRRMADWIEQCIADHRGVAAECAHA